MTRIPTQKPEHNRDAGYQPLRSYADRWKLEEMLDRALAEHFPLYTVDGSGGMGSFETLYVSADNGFDASIKIRISNHMNHESITGSDRMVWTEGFTKQQLVRLVLFLVAEVVTPGEDRSAEVLAAPTRRRDCWPFVAAE